MSISRIKRLVKLLREHKDGADFTFDFSTHLEQRACGTVGCALGIAMLDPEFVSQGLRIAEFENHPEGSHPTFKNEEGVLYGAGAVAAFFGMPFDEARATFYLCSTYNMPTPTGVTAKMVADRLEKLLKDAGAVEEQEDEPEDDEPGPTIME